MLISMHKKLLLLSHFLFPKLDFLHTLVKSLCENIIENDVIKSSVKHESQQNKQNMTIIG